MKAKILIFLILVCTLGKAQTFNFTVTYDSLRIYLKDTTKSSGTISQTYERCGLGISENGAKNTVSLFVVSGNYTINNWVTGVNMGFLAPSADSGYRKLNAIVFSNCVGTNTLVPYSDSGTVFVTPSGLRAALPHVITFLSTGSSTYVNSELSGMAIDAVTFDGLNKYAINSDFSLSGSTVTWNFNTYSNIAMSITYHKP